MPLINRPFKIITTLIKQVSLIYTACDSWTDCFHTFALSIDDTSHDVL